jgi:uncharacterized membrane protein YeaQ/YmgE (transglycosylase-associated protein family)
MTLIDFLLLLLVGAICGAVAEMIVGFSVGGLLMSIVVGFLGAMIGTWLAPQLGLPSMLAVTIGGYTIEILWAILGSILLLLVISLFRRRTISRRYV